MIVGYTSGVYDLFHIGHVRILKNAKAMCDRLIVGVSTDELVMEYKNKKPVIPFDERLEVVNSIRYVDLAVSQTSREKMDAWKHYKFDFMFVGDDWFEDSKWKSLEKEFSDVGVNIIFFPYTHSTSSTLINDTLKNLR
jgi:glycerol-3-phosphate cytidylyltransferase